MMSVLKRKIYLDTNVYSRPFDDASQTRIKVEAECAVAILQMVRQGALTCISSDILTAEVALGNPRKCINILPLLSLCQEHVEETDAVLDKARDIQAACGAHPKDSIHLASAIIGNAHWFVTCDDLVLKKAENITQQFGLKVENPVQFLQTL